MATYTAHYRSPNASTNRARGIFEFESSAKAGSKQNMKDARMAMLAEFGNEALGWVIEDIEKKSNSQSAGDGQLQLDFRDPVQEKKRIKRNFDRGLI